jgi:general secretion pathway protein D
MFLIFSLVFVLSAREQVNINFSNLAIKDFIKLVSKITNKNILISYRVNGSVNFISSSPVYDDELMGILVSVLESKGYSLIQNGSVYEVIRSIDVAKHNAKVFNQGRKLYGSLMVTQAIKVSGENVDVIAAKIRYLISKTAKLMTIKENNTILITDYPKNIETIKKVIKNIDLNNKNIVEIVSIKNAEVKKLKTRLIDISKSLFNQKIVSQKVKIILDDNINGIILVGNKENVAKLKSIVEKLDVESHLAKTVKIFNLKNSDAKSVMASLKEIVSKQKFSDPAMKPNISSSEEINSIIVIGEPIIMKGIKLIIDELDKEKYQVYIQAKIIEINKNNSEALGVKYGFAGGDVSASGLYAMSANFGDKALTDTATKTVLDALGSIGSSAKSVLALGATVDFLEANGASKAISNPSILCVNNKQSSIYVGKTISVSSGKTAVSGSTTTSYKREDVGLTLKIKPRVSSVDKVTLDVETVLENILDDGSHNATGQPVTSKQEVKTQAILRHGESIIIGGLVKSYENDTVSKVPLLGDIPLIGEALFSSKSKTLEEDNLVVILTPYVIDKSDKLSKLQKELGVLAEVQKRYNIKIFEKIKNNGLKNEAKNTQDMLLKTDEDSGEF